MNCSLGDLRLAVMERGKARSFREWVGLDCAMPPVSRALVGVVAGNPTFRFRSTWGYRYAAAPQLATFESLLCVWGRILAEA